MSMLKPQMQKGNQTSAQSLILHHASGTHTLSKQSSVWNQATTPFMSHFTLLKSLTQTKKLTQTSNCAKKNIFIVNIVCGRPCTRALPWLLVKKNGNLVCRTLPIVRGRNWRNFSGTGPLTACALLFACDARWSTTSENTQRSRWS